MMNLVLHLSVPVSVLMIGCFVSVWLGVTDFQAIALRLCMGAALLGYLGVSIFSVVWAVKIGDIGIHQSATYFSKFLFWHGVSVVAVVVLSAAGSFVVLFGTLVAF
jgi:hypothetical protein